MNKTWAITHVMFMKIHPLFLPEQLSHVLMAASTRAVIPDPYQLCVPALFTCHHSH